MQGDRDNHDDREDNEFGIELHWPADAAATGPANPPATGRRAVAPAFESASSEPAPVPEPAADEQPVPLLPAMAGRIESVHGAIASLGVRIDALEAASNTFRSVLSDRLSGDVDTISHRLDEMADELAALTDAVAARPAAAAAPVNDEVGSQIVEQVDDLVATNSNVVAEIQGLLTRIERRASSGGATDSGVDQSADVLDALAAIEDRLAATEQQQATKLRELTDGMAAIEERLAESSAVGGDTAAATELVEALRRAAGEVQAAGDELRDVRVAVQTLQGSGAPPVAAAVPPGDLDDLREELQAELGALRDELTQLRRRIGLRAKAPAVLEEDQIAAIVEAVAARIKLPDAAPALRLDAAALDELADRVTERLAQSFEVVTDEPAPPPPARAPRRNT